MGASDAGGRTRDHQHHTQTSSSNRSRRQAHAQAQTSADKRTARAQRTKLTVVRGTMGGSRSSASAGVGTGVGTVSPSVGRTVTPELPADVTSRGGPNSRLREYVFEVDGRDVELNAIRDYDTGEVAYDFTVDGSYSVGRLDSQQGARAGLKLIRILNYDVGQRPEGTLFRVSAWTGDGRAEMRGRAYQMVGFSEPRFRGGTQYAIKRGGRLQPLSLAEYAQELNRRNR